MKGHAKARFDLVIYAMERMGSGKRRKMPIRIIETKRGRRSVVPHTSVGKQVCGYYERYGIPVDCIGGMRDATDYLTKIMDLVPLPAPEDAWPVLT